jgi:hypothetical protein
MMDKYDYAKLAASSAILSADSERILEELGDGLAKEHGYPMEGISAVHYHIIQKYNWLPRDVKSLSIEDMQLVCALEIAAMTPTESLVDFQQALAIAAHNTIPIPSEKS